MGKDKLRKGWKQGLDRYGDPMYFMPAMQKYEETSITRRFDDSLWWTYGHYEGFRALEEAMISTEKSLLVSIRKQIAEDKEEIAEIQRDIRYLEKAKKALGGK